MEEEPTESPVESTFRKMFEFIIMSGVIGFMLGLVVVVALCGLWRAAEYLIKSFWP